MHNVPQVGLQWWDTWQARPVSERRVVNRVLVAEIRVIHRVSRETYDSPSIWAAAQSSVHGDAPQSGV